MVSISEVLQHDLDAKGGNDLDTESERLTALYLGQARELTLQQLKGQGQGDPELRNHPFQSKVLRRMVQSVAVVWSQPPARLVEVGGEVLPDDDKRVLQVADFYRETRVDRYLKTADRWRTLLGQVVLYAAVSPRGRVELRVFQPHAVHRWPDATAADDMALDQAVAFLVRRDAKDPAKNVYHLWEQVAPNQWEARRVNGKDEQVDGEDALFPGAAAPYDGAPFLQIYDELPEGRAWLPIDTTRSAFALGQNVLLNEIAYLLKQEAHTPVVVTGHDASKALPEKWGPGQIWAFSDPEAQAQALALNPKLLESIGVSRHFLELFAAGEGLPADHFLATRRYETGAAGRLRLQDLDARRQDQLGDAAHTEAELWSILRDVHNAEQLGPALAPVLDLRVEFARPWFPTDVADLQAAWAWEFEHGTGSVIDYYQERHRISRELAIQLYHRVQEDRRRYPLQKTEAKAPAAPLQDMRGRPPVDNALGGPDGAAIVDPPHVSQAS